MAVKLYKTHVLLHDGHVIEFRCWNEKTLRKLEDSLHEHWENQTLVLLEFFESDNDDDRVTAHMLWWEGTKRLCELSVSCIDMRQVAVIGCVEE